MSFRGMAFAGALLALPALGAEHAAFDSEADFRWTYRLLILEETGRGERRAALEAGADAIRERDLLWFLFGEAGPATNSPRGLSPGLVAGLRDRMTTARGDVILVGKDGGVKLVSDELDLPAIFARIDAMPMRRREMSR